MRKEVAANDDVSNVDDVDVGDRWHSINRAADRGDREAAEKIRLLRGTNSTSSLA